LDKHATKAPEKGPRADEEAACVPHQKVKKVHCIKGLGSILKKSTSLLRGGFVGPKIVLGMGGLGEWETSIPKKTRVFDAILPIGK